MFWFWFNFIFIPINGICIIDCLRRKDERFAFHAVLIVFNIIGAMMAS